MTSRQTAPRRRQINVALEMEIVDQLTATRDEDGIPITQQIRRALRLYFQARDGGTSTKVATTRKAR